MIDVIILISGSSVRMGKEKALLPFSNSKSFICHLIETYTGCLNVKVIVVANSRNIKSIQQDCKSFVNEIVYKKNLNPERGRLWSILSGLQQVKKENGVFIQNIDNPFVNSELINLMQKNYKSDSFLVPQFNGKNGHPLLLGSELVKELKEKGDSIFDLKSFLKAKKKNFIITKDKSVLANINCMKEYQKWFPNIEF